MPFSVQQAWLVNADHLKRPVYLHPTQVISMTLPSCAEDQQGTVGVFVAISKSRHNIARLLVGSHATWGNCKRPLAHTSVIEKLIELRDAERRAQLEKLSAEMEAIKAQERVDSMSGKIDVSITGAADSADPNSRKKEGKKKSKPSAVPVRLPHNFVTIKTPDFPDVPSIDVKVLIQPSSNQQNSKSLWMQMTATNIAYLSGAVRAWVVKR